MSLKHVLQLLRIPQWLKNTFVFLPLFFSGQLLNLDLLYICIIVFFSFSFAASSIYCFNDIRDAETDRKHPKKCQRPIASGKISKKNAGIIQAICLIISMLLPLLSGSEHTYIAIAVIASYYILNILYCTILKYYSIIDVTVVAIGFVLRVLAGGLAAGIYLSEWIILMTFLLALFLAFAKRRDDVVLFNKTGIRYRTNTNNYNLEFLNQVMTIISSVTMIAYIMYTVSPEVTQRFDSRYIYLTSIFVLVGIIRYLQITIVDTNSGSPTKILLHDRIIQTCIICWIAAFAVIVYF